MKVLIIVLTLLSIILIAGCTNQSQQSESVSFRCENGYIVDNPDKCPTCSPSWECSNWSACNSPGYRTRICNDTQNCGTISSRPALRENCDYERSWHLVNAFTSTTAKTTDTFQINGEKWRFTWSCEKRNEHDSINIGVYKEGSGDSFEEFIFLQKCPETPETSFVYSGKGNYYFDIMLANIDSWTISVEDWY